MPKLNTTVDKIELTDHKTESTKGLPANNDYWSDERYPSARSLYCAYNDLVEKINTQNTNFSSDLSDLTNEIQQEFRSLPDYVYPVGSIYVSDKIEQLKVNGVNTGMYTPQNPVKTLGVGVWELQDVAFKTTSGPLKDVSGFWTATNATLRSESYVWISDHTIQISLGLNLDKTKLLTDNSSTTGATNTLGIMHLEKLGLVPGMTTRGEMPTKLWGTTFSEGGNSLIFYEIGVEGTITVLDVIRRNGTAVASTVSNDSGFSFFINLTISVNDFDHDDSQFHAMDITKCDKFYWKRIE